MRRPLLLLRLAGFRAPSPLGTSRQISANSALRGVLWAAARDAAARRSLALSTLNLWQTTWQIDGGFLRFSAVCCALTKSRFSIGKSSVKRVWVGRDSNPEPTP